jgi:hypothetical protein
MENYCFSERILKPILQPEMQDPYILRPLPPYLKFPLQACHGLEIAFMLIRAEPAAKVPNLRT